MSKMGFVFVISVILISNTLQAQVARLVHYQGVLKDAEGDPFSGATDLQFRLYKGPRSEKAIWSEVHKNVEITNGNYEVLLGSQNPLKLSFYEYYLEVKAEGIESNDQRKTIVGSGYNYRLSFLFSAYTIVWLALFAYILSISRRQKKIIAELETLAKVKMKTETV